MKTAGKFLVGAAAAAMMTVTAAPAQAQWGQYDRYDRSDRYYDRDRGVDAGDIIAGVAIIGGIAAILGAVNNDAGRYGYDNRYRYRDYYTNAVRGCGYEAQRYARGGRIQVVDVDRAGGNRFLVRGVIQGGYSGGYGGGYGGGYDRYDRYDRYNRFGGGGYGQTGFTCYAHANGRVLDFRVNRY